MDTLQSVISLMLPGLWLASIDLKDAYFCMPIHEAHRKYLRFVPEGVIHEYTVTPLRSIVSPQGIHNGSQSHCGLRGIQIHAYLDNLLLMGPSAEEVLQALALTIQTLVRAGFIIKLKKSHLTPSQNLVYVGG